MRKRLALTLWLVGSAGAVLFTLFWISAIIYTRRTSLAAFAVVAFGCFLTYQALRAYREEKYEDARSLQTKDEGKQTSTLWRALFGCNIGVVGGAAFLSGRHVDRTILYQTIALIFIIMNAYVFLAFWMWGSETD